MNIVLVFVWRYKTCFSGAIQLKMLLVIIWINCYLFLLQQQHFLLALYDTTEGL